MIALRGLVAFPNTSLQFDLKRDISLKALNYAVEHHLPIFLMEQANPLADEVDRKIAYIEVTDDTMDSYRADIKTCSDFIGGIVEKFGAEKCDTIDELCEKSDVIVILAPSNPETHLRYAEAVLKHGKRTYIDKTFAPDSAVAKEIFALGEKYGTPFFSTSALRYATELDAVDSPDSLLVTGGGSNLPEYFIHLGEMVVKKMGAVKCVKATANGSQWIIGAKTASGKDATMIWGASMPYGAYMTKDGKETWKSLKSPFFDGLIADMLNFFETGKASFDCSETLDVMALRDAALKAVECPGEEIEV